MRHPSITLRLTLLFASISAVVLIGIGTFLAHAVERHFEDQDHVELAGKLELTRHALTKVHNQSELSALPQHLQDALVGHPGLSVIVTHPDGSLLFATTDAYFPATVLERVQNTPRHNHLISWTYDGHSYRGLIASAESGIPTAGRFTVAVSVDTGHHNEFMQVFAQTLWVSLTLGVISAALLGGFAARQGMAPARRIARVAKSITAERMQERLPLETVPSELVDLATSFNGMLARLEDAFQRLSNFSSDLAHELRAPISNLLTQTEVALSKTRTAAEYQDILASNLEEYERLSRMISDMLFLAKADHGLIVPHAEDIDIAQEAQNLIEFYEPLAEEMSVRIITQGQKHKHLRADRLMIRRALSNLISNALRHCEPEGTITIGIEHTDEHVSITVSNPGEAIPEQHHKHLFDRFYRIDSARERTSEGAGLGLALTKSIVEAHHGQISASSVAGTTSFTMRFPAP